MNVGIISQKEFRSLGTGGGLMGSMPLDEALDSHWDTPALFCTYSVQGEHACPRLRKVDQREVERLGGTVQVRLLAFDYDLRDADGKKRQWADSDEAIEFMMKLVDAPGMCPAVFYSTKHGARLIYELDHAVSPQSGEAAYQAMLGELRDIGIHSDENTSDWTRFFTLPFVTKESGEKLWELETIFLERFPGALPIDVDALMQSLSVYAPLVIEDDKPSPGDVEKLLFCMGEDVNGNMKRKATPQARRAKALLKESPWRQYLFDGVAAEFPAGTRDTKVNSMAFSIVRRIWGKIEETGPEFAYAIMHGGVSKGWELVKEGEDWTDVLWEKVCRIWEQQHETEAKEQQTLEQKVETMLVGFRKQVVESDCSMQSLMASAESKTEFDLMRQYLLVRGGSSNYFYLGRDGRYSRHPANSIGIYTRIRAEGLGDVYGLTDEIGEAVTFRDLVLGSCCAPDVVEAKLGLETGELRGFGTGTLTLYFPGYYLRPFEPLYVPEVDAWLRLMGGVNYERLCDWIAHAQDIYRPICALSLSGPKGVGKSLLGELLACMFGPGPKNTEAVVTEQYNGGLTENPVIQIDEGLSMMRAGKVDEVLRRYVTGGMIAIRKMRTDPFTAEVYPRILISANNLDTLRDAISRRDLDEQSHLALTERILHIDACFDAEEVLDRDITETWIKGRCLGLRHFAYLYANRKPSKWAHTGRLLVEGDPNSKELAEMRLASPMAEVVQLSLCRLIENSAYGNRSISVLLLEDNGEVYVAAEPLMVYMTTGPDAHQYCRDTRVSVRNVSDCLKKLAKRPNAQVRRELNGKTRRVVELDLVPLIAFAEGGGLPSERMEQLIVLQKSNGVLEPRASLIHLEDL